MNRAVLWAVVAIGLALIVVPLAISMRRDRSVRMAEHGWPA